MNKNIELPNINPASFFGSKNKNINYIKELFPSLKISSRGSTISIKGEEKALLFFEKKLDLMLDYFQTYNSINFDEIDNLMHEDGHLLVSKKIKDNIIVYGNSGTKIAAKTINQKKLVDAVKENALVFAIGPAGTGKTFTAVALAVSALKQKEVKKIILTRPAVEAGENLGFLPGDLKEKLDPYLMPLYDALKEMIPLEKLKELIDEEVIEIAPLAFMRGRTLDKAFVILDEAQNTTKMQMKMFLTRMGKTAKFIVNGDLSQIDLPKKQSSGLAFALESLKNVTGIQSVYFNETDVIRHRLVKKIITAFEKTENT